MEDLVSVIVPVYNVGDYLDKCIKSIAKQSYDNIEIIIIDDGSTDRSSGLCELWKKKDSRCKVIHKKNGGLSDARNVGLKHANGKYVVFVDSDDYVDKQYVKKLHHAITSSGASLAMCAFYEVRDSDLLLREFGLPRTISGKSLLMESFSSKLWSSIVVAWNKMYRKEIFDSVKFEVGRLHEDEYITDRILFGCDNVAIIEEPLYFYRKDNSSSITKQAMDKKRAKDILDAFSNRVNFFKKSNKELYILSLRQYFDMLLQVGSSIYRTDKVFLKNINNKLRTIFSRHAALLTTKQHIKYYCFSIFPFIFSRHILKRSREE